MPIFNSLTSAALREAAVIKDQIEQLTARLGHLLSGDEQTAKPAKTKSTRTKTGRRTMSPEAREKIAAAQRARWAKSKKASPSKATAPGKSKKGGLTPEGRAKLAASMKARWAAKRAAAK